MKKKHWLDATMNSLLMSKEDREKDYNKRKLGRVEPEENNGIGVSTCYTVDFGYETALLDTYGTHPVERYKTREQALLGHRKWLTQSTQLSRVICLGTGDGVVPDEIISLMPTTADPNLLDKMLGEKR